MEYEMIKSDEVARMLKCSRATITNLRQKGKIRGYRVSSSYYYFKSDIVKLIEERKRIMEERERMIPPERKIIWMKRLKNVKSI